MKTRFMIKSVALLLTILVLPFLGSTVMAIEEPEFKIIKVENDLEYRQYDSFIIAETLVKEADNRSAASNEGFRRLFRYISGDNSNQQKIEMTAPVIQPGEPVNNGIELGMTAPVQQSLTEEGWMVAFVLPLEYSLDTAPVPDNSQITLREIAPRLMAVKTFSGRWTEKNIGRHQGILIDRLVENEIKPVGNVEFAAYNAPFALPFMRRNEVMVEIGNIE